MKKTAVFILFLLLSSMAGFSQANIQQPIDAASCNNKFFTGLLEEDDKSLDGLLSGDFSVVGMDGKAVDKSTLLQAISEGYVTVQSGMISNVQVKNYTDVSIVTGSWNVSATIANNSFMGEVSFLTVCAKTAGIWKVAAVQLTPVK